MANLDWSLSSSFQIRDELISLDPEEGRRIVRNAIDQLSDGQVYNNAQRNNLNWDSDVTTIRDRLERFELRKYYGPAAATWQEEQDALPEELRNAEGPPTISQEENEQNRNLLDPPRLVLRQGSSPLPSRRSRAPQDIEIPLPTGQTFGRFRDPLSFTSSITIPVPGTSGQDGNSDENLALQRIPTTVAGESMVVNHEDPTAQSTRYNPSPSREIRQEPSQNPHANPMESPHPLDLSTFPNDRQGFQQMQPIPMDEQSRLVESYEHTRYNMPGNIRFQLPHSEATRGTMQNEPEARAGINTVPRTAIPTIASKERTDTHHPSTATDKHPSFHLYRDDLPCSTQLPLGQRSDRTGLEAPQDQQSQTQHTGVERIQNNGRHRENGIYYVNPNPNALYGIPSSYCNPPMSHQVPCREENRVNGLHPQASRPDLGPRNIVPFRDSIDEYGQYNVQEQNYHPYAAEYRPYGANRGNRTEYGARLARHDPCRDQENYPQVHPVQLSEIPQPGATNRRTNPLPPHTERTWNQYDSNAHGYRTERENLDGSTFLRESRTCDLLHRWRITFKGKDKEDPEEFLARLETCRESFGLTLMDLIKTLPAVFDSEAAQWFRREFKFWATYEDFVDAFRLQYCVDDLQERLQQELQRRTQGPLEEISTYLVKLRALLDQVKPPLKLEDQLNRAYSNLHPSYKRNIERETFATFTELQRLGKKEELRRTQYRAYRNPPTPEESLFPNTAYVAPKNKRFGKTAAIEATDDEEEVKYQQNQGKIAPVGNLQPSENRGNNARANQQPPAVPKAMEQTQSEVIPPLTQRNFARPNYSNIRPPPIYTREQMIERKRVEPCFNCGQYGHWRTECKNPPRCQRCGTEGHVSSNCKVWQNQGNGQGREQ